MTEWHVYYVFNIGRVHWVARISTVYYVTLRAITHANTREFWFSKVQQNPFHLRSKISGQTVQFEPIQCTITDHRRAKPDISHVTLDHVSL